SRVRESLPDALSAESLWHVGVQERDSAGSGPVLEHGRLGTRAGAELLRGSIVDHGHFVSGAAHHLSRLRSRGETCMLYSVTSPHDRVHVVAARNTHTLVRASHHP